MTLRTWLLLSSLFLLQLPLPTAPAAAQPGAPQKTGELPTRPPGDAQGQPVEPPPQRIELKGTVYLGDQPKEARLEFLTAAGEKPVVATDAAGNYRLDAVGPLRKATIELRGREGLPFHEFFFEPVRASGQRDFHLPDTGLRVKVVDAATGKGIPDATVRLRNSFPAKDRTGKPLPPRTPGGEAPITSLSQVAKTNRDGIATSYYLAFPGLAEVSAIADGYAESGESRKLAIADKSQLEAEIRLQPLGKKAALRVLLPGGQPAAGAAVLVLASLEPMKVLAAGAADAAGLIELPAGNAGSILAVRHPGAAFHIGKWQPAKAPEEARLKLEPAAEPLTVEARSGGQPLPYAEVALIAGGQRLTTHLLYQLTGASPMTGADGRWKGESLPRSAVKVLVFGRGDVKKADAIRAGGSDARAVAVAYPWPALAEVAAID